MSREKEFSWAYCEKILGYPKLLCKLWKRKCSRGIYRFNYHLAEILSHDIGLYKIVDENVKHQATLAIDMLSQHNAKKEKKKNEIITPWVANFSSTTPLSSPSVESSMQFPSFPHMPPSPSQTQGQMNPHAFDIGGGKINTYFFPTQNQVPNLPWIPLIGKKNIHSQVGEAISKFCYYSDIPFDYVLSPYWKSMIDVVVVLGLGFKAPSPESIKIYFLL